MQWSPFYGSLNVYTFSFYSPGRGGRINLNRYGSKLDCIQNALLFVMNQSISSLTIPPGRPQGIHTSSLPGGSVFAQLSLPGGRGFELEKFSAVLKEKCKNFSVCFKEAGGSLKSRCSCAVSY